MEQISVIEADLKARSKNALLLGILSEAIPTAMIVLVYIIYLFGFFGTLIAQDFELDSASPVFAWLTMMLLGFCLAGVVMLVLGAMAWRKARAVGVDARENGVRRPPMSVVAHVFGIVGLITGIILVVAMLVMTCFMGIAGAIVSAL